MASQFGLNENHHASVLSFMRFSRFQRSQTLRAVGLGFDDIKNRLSETTYTIDEVTSFLEDLQKSVSEDVESDLMNSAHTNVLLMLQMCRQAEKWHLTLYPNISELENEKLLKDVKKFEETTLSHKEQSGVSGFKNRLEPMREGGPSELLKMRIDELEEENDRLRSEIASTRNATRGQVPVQATPDGSADTSEEIEKLRKDLKVLSGSMEGNLREKDSVLGNMEKDLTGAKHELLKVQSMLDMAEKELEKKVSHTVPFKNLQKMLQTKTERVKELTRMLQKYEDI